MEENKNFEELQRYTLEACNMKTFPEETFTGNGNKWLELIYAWDVLLEGGSDEIFEEACHIIMWGIPRQYRRSPYNKIVELVTEEMLRDGDAFNAWDSCEFFEDAIGYRCSEMDPYSNHNYRYSIEHYQYLSDKFLLKVRYSKAKYANEKARYEKAVALYEAAIKKIVPSASSWNEKHWIDENHIFDEIATLYGVDYRNIDCLEYGRILIILMGWEHSSFLAR